MSDNIYIEMTHIKILDKKIIYLYKKSYTSKW
jgi:hypothetical protein